MDNLAPFSVKFYLNDPRNDGVLIQDENGETEFMISGIPSRENHIVNLEGWTVPEEINGNSKIYVVIDDENDIEEVHENNNIAWALVNPNLGIGTSNEEELPASPKQFHLNQNYPNPFNPSTVISYHLPASERINLTVYDIMGRQVAKLVDERQAPGTYQVQFDASGLASGMYIYQLTGESLSLTKKMLLIK